MKFLFPIACGLLLAACSSIMPEPKPGTAAHQQWLHEQARKNFYAMKEAERKAHPQFVRTAEPVVVETPRLKPFTAPPSFAFTNPFATKPAPAVKRHAPPKPATTFQPTPAKPIAKTKPLPPFERTRKTDDTLYYYDMPHGPEPNSARYRAYKLQYARELAKSPQDLTSEEREWVRRHYRD
jgi:hypothetical protein